MKFFPFLLLFLFIQITAIADDSFIGGSYGEKLAGATGIGKDRGIGIKFKVGKQSKVIKYGIKLDESGGAPLIKMGVYKDKFGKPGALVASSNTVNVPLSGVNYEFNANGDLLTPGIYWVVAFANQDTVFANSRDPVLDQLHFFNGGFGYHFEWELPPVFWGFYAHEHSLKSPSTVYVRLRPLN